MTASAWTDDRIGRLKILWLEGQTAEQIARTLANGITRNAVLGKVHRMGLSVGRAAGPTRAPTKAEPRPRAARLVRPMAATTGVAVPVVAPAMPSPVPEPGGATVQSVGRDGCRWPLGDPLTTGFSLCGNRVERGAYCGAHAQIAYRPVRDTPQSLERLARLR